MKLIKDIVKILSDNEDSVSMQFSPNLLYYMKDFGKRGYEIFLDFSTNHCISSMSVTKLTKPDKHDRLIREKTVHISKYDFDGDDIFTLIKLYRKKRKEYIAETMKGWFDE